jgi:hypothetical protein
LIYSFYLNGLRKTQAKISMRVILGAIAGGKCVAGVRNGTISTSVMNVKDAVRGDLRARMGVVIKEITEGENQVLERLQAGDGSVMDATVREEDFRDRRLLSLN